MKGFAQARKPHVKLRQGDWRRPARGRLRRPQGHHGDGRACRTYVPGWHAQRQPPCNDSRNRDAEEAEGPLYKAGPKHDPMP